MHRAGIDVDIHGNVFPRPAGRSLPSTAAGVRSVHRIGGRGTGRHRRRPGGLRTEEIRTGPQRDLHLRSRGCRRIPAPGHCDRSDLRIEGDRPRPRAPTPSSSRPISRTPPPLRSTAGSAYARTFCTSIFRRTDGRVLVGSHRADCERLPGSSPTNKKAPQQRWSAS